MKKIKIGSTVTYRLFGGDIGTALIEGIEICKDGDKYGRRVASCDLDRHRNVTVELSDNHWCYGNQILSVKENNTKR